MMFKIMMKASITCSALLLTGCEAWMSDSISSICENAPELCVDLHKIGDCRFKRTDVIRARYYDKTTANEINKRKLLIELDEYESCLELTLFMQFTRNKERKKRRLENYLKTQALIQAHLAESKGTKDPMLAYYLWTHYQDIQARDIFLSVATKEDMNNPHILFKLATFYAKDNPQDALEQFYKALHVSKSLDNISADNFVMIMTIFYQHKRFEDAYVWALITKKEDEHDQYPVNLEMILQKGHINGEILIVNKQVLRDKAQHYYDQLSEGKFQAKAPPLIVK